MADLKQLGKYKVIEVLGKGSMGVVYKGFDPIIERNVALKTVRKEMMDQHLASEIIARFKNEAQAAGRLTHPGIVAIYDYGEDASTAYIAMEFVQGRSLRHYLVPHESLGLQRVVSIMGELLQALDYAHEHGVVHRDIKPANIIVMTNGRLKVADFGIARIDTSSLTAVGSIMGTPSYMSPEQYAGLPVDRRTDVFSSGIVLYELLTGSKPFEGSSDTIIAYKICHEPHRKPSEVSPQAVPAVFDGVIAKALAKKADERYPTARDFADALLAAYETRGNASAEAESTLLNTIVPQAPERKDTNTPPPDTQRKDTTTPPPDAARKDTTTPPLATVRKDTTVPPLEPKAIDFRALEDLLASYVGPIARVLIKKAANTTADGRLLLGLLADSVQGEQEKKAFLAAALSKVRQTLVPQAGSDAGQAGVNIAPQPIGPADIEKATSRLVPYLGPIAKIVVKKAAVEAPDMKTLYLRLADSIANAEDRNRFLKDAGQV